MAVEELAFTTLTSLILFMFTVVTGYITLFLAYFWSNRLQVWYGRDSFDKALQTFAVGAFISSFTVFGLKPPLESGSSSDWSTWFQTSFVLMILLETAVILLIIAVVSRMIILAETYKTKPDHIRNKIVILLIAAYDTIFATAATAGGYDFSQRFIRAAIADLTNGATFLEIISRNIGVLFLALGGLGGSIIIWRTTYGFVKRNWQTLKQSPQPDIHVPKSNGQRHVP